MSSTASSFRCLRLCARECPYWKGWRFIAQSMQLNTALCWLGCYCPFYAGIYFDPFSSTYVCMYVKKAHGEAFCVHSPWMRSCESACLSCQSLWKCVSVVVTLALFWVIAYTSHTRTHTHTISLLEWPRGSTASNST